MTKEKRLGRGLEALLGRIPGSAEPAATSTTYPDAGEPTDAGGTFRRFDAPHARAMVGQGLTLHEIEQFAAAPQPQLPSELDPQPGDGLVRVAIQRIDNNPFQPRRDFDEAEINAMAESLQEFGLLQPVVVRRMGERYQLVAGERRLRAAAKAGWSEVPVQVIAADDRQVAEMAIVENLHRKDLNSLEKAASFQRYIEQYGCTQEELASRLKIDRSTIANLIRLLELPDAVQESVRQGKVTQGHARALLPLGDERSQIEFCARIQREGLSVRQTEAAIQDMIHEADAEPLAVIGRDGAESRPGRPSNDHMAALEQQFRAALGLKVTLRQSAKGRGRLVIQFRSHEEFEQLRALLCADSKPQSRAG